MLVSDFKLNIHSFYVVATLYDFGNYHLDVVTCWMTNVIDNTGTVFLPLNLTLPENQNYFMDFYIFIDGDPYEFTAL